MKRRLIAAITISALFGGTGVAFAHPEVPSDASTPSSAIPSGSTVDESRTLPAEPMGDATLREPSSSDVTVLERYEGESSSEGSSLASEPESLSGVNPSSGMDDSASSGSSSSVESGAPSSYSLYPEQ